MASNNDDRVPIIVSDDDSEAPKNCCSGVVCNPSHSCYRYLALLFMCFIGFGSYFCYDNPGALQDNFKEDFGISTTQFTLLYSMYSWPNTFLCFIGGFLIDRVFGIRFGTLLYMTILLIGAFMFALGGYINKFWVMVLGRFVFGIGGESLAVAQNYYGVRWFKGKELNMVFGLQLSFARVGSTVNFLVMEPLYKYIGNFYTGYERTGVVLFIASTTCFISLICGIVLAWMDKRAEHILEAKSSDKKEETVKLSDIRYFPLTFWLVAAICVTFYVAIFPFVALGKMFFEKKFDFSAEDANVVNSLIYLLSAIASPVMGFFIDKIGRNIAFLVISVSATIGAHAILTFTFINPYVGMVILGLSYSMVASALWPLVALIVPDHQLGTAYGICQAVQNFGMAIVSIIAGLIVDYYGYFMLEMFFHGCLFITLILAVWIGILDSANKGTLNMKPKERAEHALKQQQASSSESIANYSVENSEDELDAFRSDRRIRARYVAKVQGTAGVF